MKKSVTVRVPATTANLGPGFDSFGCALALYNVITFTLEGNRLCFDGCDEEFCNEQNLAVQAYDAVCGRLGVPREAGLKISIRAAIPVSRGLGSSAALLAAGATAADVLHGGSLDRNELLTLCTAIEGHPDNLAPAFFGGLTASMLENGRPDTVRCPVHPEIGFVAVIPDFPLSTHIARSVLPQSVAYADAVYNLSHAVILMKALEQGNAALIARALRDRLHQPYREKLIPHYAEAKTAALRQGAISYCISGAGPTQLALVSGDARGFAARLQKEIAAFAPGWHVLALSVDNSGAVVLGNETDFSADIAASV